MKIIDERQRQEKQRQKERERDDGSYSENIRAKWFFCAFKLEILQLIYKSLICKSNLELALSIILKEQELCVLKHVVVECRCLKILDSIPFLTCSSILVLKFPNCC